jgi:hypothetical protein
MNTTEYAIKRLQEWKSKCPFQYKSLLEYVNPAEAWWMFQEVLPKAGMSQSEFNNIMGLLKYVGD